MKHYIIYRVYHCEIKETACRAEPGRHSTRAAGTAVMYYII